MEQTKKELITEMAKKLNQLDASSIAILASNANILLARQELEKKGEKNNEHNRD